MTQNYTVFTFIPPFPTEMTNPAASQKMSHTTGGLLWSGVINQATCKLLCKSRINMQGQVELLSIKSLEHGRTSQESFQDQCSRILVS